MAISTVTLVLTLTIFCSVSLIDAKPRKGGEPVVDPMPDPTPTPDSKPMCPPGVMDCKDHEKPTNNTDYEGMFDFMGIDDVAEFGMKGIRVMKIHEEEDNIYIREFMVDTAMTIKMPGNMSMMSDDDPRMMMMMPSNDTQENMIQAMAKEKGIETPEQFAMGICFSHMHHYDHIKKCQVNVEEVPWRGMGALDEEHKNTFIHNPSPIRTAEIHHERGERPKVFSGLKDLKILKILPPRMENNRNNSYNDHMRNDYMRNHTMRNDTMRNDTMRNDTMRNDTMRNDTMHNAKRVFGAVVGLKWLYMNSTDYDRIWKAVYNLTMKALSSRSEDGDFMESLQRTAYSIVAKVLKYLPEIYHAQIELPHFFYHLADLEKMGIKGNKEVFSPAGPPHEFIKAALKRKEHE